MEKSYNVRLRDKRVEKMTPDYKITHNPPEKLKPLYAFY